MCGRILTVAAVATLAIAVAQVRADTITVPNGDFELIYKPGSTTITAQLSPAGGSWTQGVGPNCPIDSGEYAFSDQTTGTQADIPGWLGYDRQGWIDWGGTYGRDQTTGNLQGSVANQTNHTSGGSNCYLANGGGWGNPAGGLIVSDASLGNILSDCTYTLSMYRNGDATPVVLSLLANGAVLTPTSSVDPNSAGWQQYSRTYEAEDLTSYVGQAMTIVLGLGRDASGAQSQFDDVSLSYYVLGPPGQATDPNPHDGATGIWTGADVILSWTAGFDSDSSNVYFGTDPTPDSGEFQGNQVETAFNAGALNAETTYNWRIDSVNTLGTTTGEVWSFTMNETPSPGRNTFLVPIPSSGAGWQELAYLAAVPASAAANTDEPSVIALDDSGAMPDEVYWYLSRYNPNAYTIDPCSSLDEVACYLAATFWTTTTSSVVLCEQNDFAGALAASAMAGRLEVPLLFFDGSAGLSAAALNIIDNDLQCAAALTVSGNSTVTSQLAAISVSQTSLADADDILGWMINNDLPVDYFAVCNPNDRTAGKVPKTSITAALMAAARGGAVIPLAYDTVWKQIFTHTDTTTSQPSGAPGSVTGTWLLGTLTLDTYSYDYVLACAIQDPWYDKANIDFNNDGDYGDPGEGPFKSADTVTIGGKDYSITVGPYTPGDVKFTYPIISKIKTDLSAYYTTLGEDYPAYICITGYFDTIPPAIQDNAGTYVDVEDIPNDHVIGEIDADDFQDVAVGRIVGNSLLATTLLGARSVTYDDLVGDPNDWANKAKILVGHGFEDCRHYTHRKLENVGFNVSEYLLKDIDLQDIPTDWMVNMGAIVQEDHAGAQGIGYHIGALLPEELQYATSPYIVEVGGCVSAGIDCVPLHQCGSLRALQKGAIAWMGTMRGTPGIKQQSRHEIWTKLCSGDMTLGQAFRDALHILRLWELEGDSGYSIYCRRNITLYGDPALNPYTPSAPSVTPAYLAVNGSNLTATGPQTWWYDTQGTDPENYIWHGPGLTGQSDKHKRLLGTRYTTNGTVTNLIQEGGIPSVLGWPTGTAYIDEHRDGSETATWRCRLIDYDILDGIVDYHDNDINYTVTVSGGGAVTPTVLNSRATNLTENSARLNGLLRYTGTETGDTDPTVAIYWGDNDGGATAGNWDYSEAIGAKRAPEMFSADIAGLSSGTTYYFRCCATNSAGNDWADATTQFVTPGTPAVTAPTVANSAATNITSNSARLNGQVTDTGGENPTVTIYWGDNDGGTTPGDWDNSENMGAQSGTFYKDISSLNPSTTYYFRCYATNSGGSDWADSTAQFDTLAAGTGTGLKGDYYDNMDFTAFTLTRTDATVNFDWGAGSPDPSIGADTFSVRWTGQVQPLFSETYTFKTNSDDGVRLWVNSQLIIDNWTDHAPTDDTGNIALSAGVKYDIKLEYYENGGGAVIKLYWSSASQTEEIIPQTQLYPAAADTTPPTPDPATFAVAPYATGTTSISMTATTATDESGVEYYFTCTAGDGNDSGWQDGTTYEDVGLSPSTQYTYTVMARDKSVNQNITAPSAEESATTDPAEPVVVFADNFESADDWTNQWTAYGQWIRTTELKHDGDYSAEIDGDVTDSALVSTNIDVTGKSSATITFWWYIDNGLDAGEYIAFDTDTGSGWVQQADRKGNVDKERTWAAESIVVDVSATNTLTIRFRGKMSDRREDAYVDQVEVSAQ